MKTLERHLPTLTTFLCFLYPATLLVASGSYAHVALVTGLIALLLLPFTLKAKLLDKSTKYAGFSVMGYLGLTILSLLLFGGDLSQLDMPSRTLLTLPIILLLLKYPPKTKWLMLGISLGGITSVIAAIYTYSLPTSSEAFGYNVGYMYVQSGGMAATLGCLSFITFFYFLREKEPAYALIAALGSVSGLVACLLSSARGTWIVTPLVLISIVFLNRKYVSRKVLIAMTAIIATAMLSASPIIISRLNSGIADIQKYTQNIEVDESSSLGIRVELWKSALYIAKEHPIFGAGFSGTMPVKNKLVESKLVQPIALEFSRAHNQFLEDLQTKGLIGLFVLLLMFGVPFKVFVSRYKAYKEHPHGVFALMGASHIVLIMSYCLTQHYLAHHSGILLMVTFTAIFLALSQPPKQTEDRSEPFESELRK